MKLNKFRIQNYKSIVDTGICYLNQDLTIMAGMNESGKTSILEAIRDFSVTRTIDQDALRVKEDTGEPIITLYFSLNEDDISYIIDSLDIENEDEEKLLKEYLTQNDIGIVKQFDNSYSLSKEFTDFAMQQYDKNYKIYYKNISPLLKKLKEYDELKNFDFSKITAKANNLTVYQLIDKIGKFINPTKKVSTTDSTGKQITKEVAIDSPVNEELKAEINEITENISNANISTFGKYYYSNLESSLVDILNDLIPEIIFFSSFEDILQFDVLVSESSKNQINVDLCNIADIDIEHLNKLITEQKYQRVTNYLNDKSAKISNIFKNEWLQDEIIISFTTDKDLIHFGIKEEGDTAIYRAEQRSKGFQWFLSFYIKLNAESSKDSCILLVDEPGLYLHARAQEDVLHLLEKLSGENEDTSVVITTHSPYLIDVDNLNRILLVEKDDEAGTQVVKPHKGATKNTLAPIITKMGFDIAKSNFIREKNILLEGISDYYYMQAFKEIFTYSELMKNISMIPAVGASQVPQLASFCIGWGLQYVAMFDKDGEGERNAEVIQNNLKELASIIFICDDNNCAIEDLFTTEDFNKFILSQIKEKIDDKSITNTKFIKEQKLDKVLLAKMFYDNVKKFKKSNFEETTLNNFNNIFKNVFAKLNIKLKESK